MILDGECQNTGTIDYLSRHVEKRLDQGRTHDFTALQEARDIAEDWMEDYNAVRPHEALQGLPPYQYEGVKL